MFKHHVLDTKYPTIQENGALGNSTSACAVSLTGWTGPTAEAFLLVPAVPAPVAADAAADDDAAALAGCQLLLSPNPGSTDAGSS